METKFWRCVDPSYDIPQHQIHIDTKLQAIAAKVPNMSQ